MQFKPDTRRSFTSALRDLSSPVSQTALLQVGKQLPLTGVRAHYAQHCFLAHMDMRIGSGLAGIHEGGNVLEDVNFHGGRYGIWTGKPSPGWQFTVVDATFEGQQEAAIRERAAGLTLIRPHFKNVPTAIAIDSGFPDELWVKNAPGCARFRSSAMPFAVGAHITFFSAWLLAG